MKRTISTLFSFLLIVLMLIALPVLGQTKKPSPAPGGENFNVYRMEEGFVDGHGVLIYYKIVGRGAPLMIVHGGPGR